MTLGDVEVECSTARNPQLVPRGFLAGGDYGPWAGGANVKLSGHRLAKLRWLMQKFMLEQDGKTWRS